jgi:PKD repeat protein
MKSIVLTILGIIMSTTACLAQLPCPTSITAIPNGDSVIAVLTPPTFDPTLTVLWTFGDGATAVNGVNQSHTYVTPGVYNVCATWQTLTCPTTTSCVSVTIVGGGSICADSIVAIANADSVVGAIFPPSFDPTLVANWTFGDGSSGTGANTSHVYAASGTYTVCCTFSSATCPTVTDCSTVSVVVGTPSACVYSFTSSLSGSTASLNNTPNAPATATILWAFGDSTANANTNDPTYTYPNQNASYTVCMTVIDVVNCGTTPIIVCDTIAITSVGLVNFDSQEYKIVPNPSKGVFYIQSNSNNNIGIKLYDLDGKVLLQQQNLNANTMVGVEHLAKGMYVIQLQTPTGYVTQKLIVQ